MIYLRRAKDFVDTGFAPPYYNWVVDAYKSYGMGYGASMHCFRKRYRRLGWAKRCVRRLLKAGWND